MKNSPFHEYNFSQFMLGTAQFGTGYGIANQIGRPSYQTVLKILECAAANGVNCLDTAPTYGDSEKIIGRAIRELGIADRMMVVTKAPHLDDNLKPAEADSIVRGTLTTAISPAVFFMMPNATASRCLSEAYICRDYFFWPRTKSRQHYRMSSAFGGA